MAELGFPVPPPPPNGTVPEAAAVGGVRYQRFPDPRSGGETTVLPEIRDLIGDADAAKARRLPRPTRPTSPAPGLSFAPGSHAGGRLTSGVTPADAVGSSSDADPANPELGAPFEAGRRIPESSSGPHLGRTAEEPSGGLRHPQAATRGDADLAGADASGLVTRPERGGSRRNLRGGAGHRAPEDDSDTVGAEQLAGDDAVSSSGRHTVPDELVRASTYRLPPDRVFRAKVRDNGTPPDDPTTRLVPKPRQS